jgi:septal ring-binding cell division protein DamX
MTSKEKERPPVEIPTESTNRHAQTEKMPGLSWIEIPLKSEMRQPVTNAEAERANIAQKRPYSVQVSAMVHAKNATRHTNELLKKGYSSHIFEAVGPNGRHWYTVRIGTYSDWETAEKAAQAYRRKEKAEAIVVKNDALKAFFKAPPKVFSVHTSAFLVYENAEKWARHLSEKGYPICILALWDAKGKLWYTTQAGVYKDHALAEQAASRFTSGEKTNARVATMDPNLLSMRKLWCSTD